MFGSGHFFGRRAGLREPGAVAELRRRSFEVKPLKRGKRQCPPIRGQLSHWRTDGKTVVDYTCGKRKWEIQFDVHDDIDEALKTAKKAARHWRSLMQGGSALPKAPASSLPDGLETLPLGTTGWSGGR